MTIAENEKRDPKGPSLTTVKRLFAQSGNRCAFPKCSSPLIEDDTVVGEICHIKATNAGGPRYDPVQAASDRHGYSNLILLCLKHHVIIDDDPEAYTVERLVKMKADHEQRTSSLSSEEVERVEGGIRLLIDQSVTALNQSGGITAQTVNIHLHGTPSERATVLGTLPASFAAAQPKDGEARFRLADQALGFHWNTIPFANGSDYEIFLSAGPAMWLRLMPKTTPERDWSADELLGCATSHGSMSLQPFFWGNLHYLRTEDGFGTYSFVDPRDSETQSVAFAFGTGEVWSIDTYLLGMTDEIYFQEIAKTFVKGLRDYGIFLKNLGVAQPFDWIAGLEDVKGRRLQVPPPPNHLGFPGHSCMSKTVSSRGTYDLTQNTAMALLPFFNQIFRKCSMQLPDYLLDVMRKSR